MGVKTWRVKVVFQTWIGYFIFWKVVFLGKKLCFFRPPKQKFLFWKIFELVFARDRRSSLSWAQKHYFQGVGVFFRGVGWGSKFFFRNTIHDFRIFDIPSRNNPPPKTDMFCTKLCFSEYLILSGQCLNASSDTHYAFMGINQNEGALMGHLHFLGNSGWFDCPITLSECIRFWRILHRWKALGVSFPTVQKSSKSDIFRESYGTFESTRFPKEM